ncbi:MAG: hypothetical protein HKM04_09415 [Legionellales bacterium]|nr:hypothetical protein [Legionellales bacterium]
MRNEKQTLTTLLKLISTSTINLQAFPERLKSHQITREDRAYLSRLGVCLKNLFGTSSRFQHEFDDMCGAINSFEAELKQYESHRSGDSLAVRFQPHVDALLHTLTQAEKEHLLKNIDAICEVLADNETIAQLSLVWGYIQAVKIENSPQNSAEKCSDTDINSSVTQAQQSLKNKAFQYLITYKAHLYSELKKAWPYPYGLATTKEGRVFLLNAKGQSLKEGDMHTDLRLLVQKCGAINEAIILAKTKEASFIEFKDHFQKKTRPIIEQVRTPSDNAFLNFMARLFSHPFGFFSKSYATKGGQVAKTIAKIEDKSVFRAEASGLRSSF